MPSWLDIRLVLGIGLVLASVLVGASVVSSARRTSGVVVARRGLAAGTVLSADDVTVAQARLPARGVYAATLADVVGKQLSRPVTGGELVPLGALGGEPAQTTLTVPLDPGSAPDLRKGDRIELWVATGRCASVVLLSDVAVQGVHVDTGAFGSGSGQQDVIISVAPQLAERVVQALSLDDAHLRAGIRTGPSALPSAGSDLPDVASCAATR